MKHFQSIILFIFCLTAAFGQNDTGKATEIIDQQLSFYLLDVENGLSNNVVNSIEQDSLGFIWVGTEEGLNRYDGTTFLVYKKNKLTRGTSVSDNTIMHLDLDKEGKLLIVTANELNVYNPKTEQFKVLNQDDGLISNNVSCLSQGPNGQLFVGINFDGLQVFDSISKRKIFTHDPNDISSLSSNEIFSLAHQNDSIIWVGTANNGLNKLNTRTNKVTRLPYGPNRTIPASRINALYTDAEGNVWIGTRHGVRVITTTKDTLKLDQSLVKGKGLSDDNVLCFEEDNRGQMWIGTRNGGLNVINKNNFLRQRQNLTVQWYLPKEDGSSVFNRTVSALKKDKNGGMWIGTSTGLNYVNPYGEPIKILNKTPENSESLGHDRVSALAEESNHKIWIGTDGAGLDLYNPTTGNFKYYQSQIDDPHSLSNDYVLSLCIDSKHRLWAGTYQGGLNRFDATTGRFIHYLQGEIIDGSDVRVIFEDRKGFIWVGTNRGGLFKYNESSDQFEYISSLGKIDVRDIKEDNIGNLWLATYGDGILRYDPTQDISTSYNTGNTQGFTSNVIFTLLILSNGDILAGSFHEGLIRLNPKDHTALSFTEEDGLSNNTVTSMVKEDESNIWLGTFKGISHFDTMSNKLYNLNAFNNVQKGEFNIGTSLKSSSGHIYMGGNYGLNIFNPDNLFRAQESYNIVFEKLEVLGESPSISNKDDHGILDASILYDDQIDLKHDEAFLSVEYAAIKYPFNKDTKYSYRVDDYINRWVDTDGTGRVDLTKIPPGDYTLYVRAKFGLSGDEVTKSLKIAIQPPFWETPWAYLIYIAFASGLLWAGMKFYSDRIKLVNSLLFEKKQRQLEHDFNEERVRFFTSFSHELKTPLTLILAPLEDLISEIKTLKQKNSLKLIYKNANLLLQRINRLLEFRKTNLGLSELSIEKYNLTAFLEQWVDHYYPLAKKRDIALSYDFPDEPLFAWVDLEKMHIVFNNLLSNAFKYMDDKGEIYVSLSYDEENFEIKVRDTGYGIAPNELEHIFERYYRSDSAKDKEGIGIGLALSKNLVELHLGTIQIESEINKGSVFTVTIPRNKHLFENAIIERKEPEPEEPTASKELEEWVLTPELMDSEKKAPNINVKDSKELILLVDDHPDILNYMEGLLEGKYDLIYARDGKEGLEKALRYIPDLIVSDVMMPKLNGMELCNRLKKTTETTHIPIILLTAKGNVESIQEGYTYGADDYIVKPFNSQIFQTRIRNLLDIRTQLRSYFTQKGEINMRLIDENATILEKEKSFLNRLEQIILEQLNEEKIDVWMVAKEIGMSRTSLFRKVKAITGLNINQIITKIKIDKAAELLKSGDYTVAQASYEVGFNNVKYFRKLFKEQYEQLPSDLTRNDNE